jgi:hypothetical protein
MATDFLHIEIDPKTLANVEELAVITGRSLATVIASAVAESLLRERVEYGVFRATLRDYDGLLLDGTVRILPAQEVA